VRGKDELDDLVHHCRFVRKSLECQVEKLTEYLTLSSKVTNCGGHRLWCSMAFVMVESTDISEHLLLLLASHQSLVLKDS